MYTLAQRHAESRPGYRMLAGALKESSLKASHGISAEILVKFGGVEHEFEIKIWAVAN